MIFCVLFSYFFFLFRSLVWTWETLCVWYLTSFLDILLSSWRHVVPCWPLHTEYKLFRRLCDLYYLILEAKLGVFCEYITAYWVWRRLICWSVTDVSRETAAFVLRIDEKGVVKSTFLTRILRQQVFSSYKAIRRRTPEGSKIQDFCGDKYLCFWLTDGRAFHCLVRINIRSH
jgi:hypothetical protein